MGNKIFTTDDECELEKKESELIKGGYALSSKGELRPGEYRKREEAHPLAPKTVLVVEWMEIQD